METFSTLESLLNKYSQVQILDTESLASNPIDLYLKTKEKVSVASEALQQKIRRAVTPFWQERYISIEGEEALRVKDLLSEKFFLQTDFFVAAEAFPVTDSARLKEALVLADLKEDVLEKKLISLSNGELRRILLARLWMERPEIAYFDDLFGGLDPAYRKKLATVIAQFLNTDLKVIVRLVRADEIIEKIPAFVFENNTFRTYSKKETDVSELIFENKKQNYEIKTLKEYKRSDELLFDLKNVTVRFGETEIIKNLNWQMYKGEHFVIMGPNGAGKSTLLALLSGDHPQIYNNDITLLGKVPGKGLDIWEHKSKIGFFSPELALHYKEKLTLFEVLCTGFQRDKAIVHDLTFDEKQKAREWVSLLGFENQNILFEKLSPVEKRLALIAKAAIAEPLVLILDEPTQGLDSEPRNRLFSLLDKLAEHSSIIFVSHYNDWPRAMNRLLFMPKIENGR